MRPPSAAQSRAGAVAPAPRGFPVVACPDSIARDTRCLLLTHTSITKHRTHRDLKIRPWSASPRCPESAKPYQVKPPLIGLEPSWESERELPGNSGIGNAWPIAALSASFRSWQALAIDQFAFE